jgi:tRNA/tmRNA/rRNA uracil-C5-methylase (TrmA/RlmC/RlmD family)
LIELGISPDIIIEPTCGVGNFIEAASHFFKKTNRIIGVEINPVHLQELGRKKQLLQDKRIEIKQVDFFQLNWLSSNPK